MCKATLDDVLKYADPKWQYVVIRFDEQGDDCEQESFNRLTLTEEEAKVAALGETEGYDGRYEFHAKKIVRSEKYNSFLQRTITTFILEPV